MLWQKAKAGRLACLHWPAGGKGKIRSRRLPRPTEAAALRAASQAEWRFDKLWGATLYIQLEDSWVGYKLKSPVSRSAAQKTADACDCVGCPAVVVAYGRIQYASYKVRMEL